MCVCVCVCVCGRARKKREKKKAKQYKEKHEKHGHTHTQKKSKKPHPEQGKEGGYGGSKGQRCPALSATCACKLRTALMAGRRDPGVHAQRGVAKFRACVLV